MQGKGRRADGERGRATESGRSTGWARGRRRAWSEPALAAARAFLAITPVETLRACDGKRRSRPRQVSRLVIDFYLGLAG